MRTLLLLFRADRVGFTDVVKRPSTGAAELHAQDFKVWAPVVREKLLRYRPGIAWFHGGLAYAHYLKYAEGVGSPKSWGKQPLAIGTTSVFVTPNPSPANAAFSLSDLIEWYRALKELRDAMRNEELCDIWLPRGVNQTTERPSASVTTFSGIR